MANYYRLRLMDRGKKVTKYYKAANSLVPDIDVVGNMINGRLMGVEKITQTEYEKHMIESPKTKPRYRRRNEPRESREIRLSLFE